MDQLMPVQYTGGTTTGNSQEEGRLKVDAGANKKRTILKKIIKKKPTAGFNPAWNHKKV
jgi:hypothetical protein